MKFTRHSGIYTLKVEQEIEVGLEKAWAFFSDPNNLSKITPPSMGFNITSEPTNKVYPGQIITYIVNPFPMVPTNWVTEITQVKEQEFFIDEQRVGPYTMWHHEHFFEKISETRTLIIDKISYQVPLGILGRLVEPFLVRPQLKKIFNYRQEVIEKVLN